MGQSSSSQTDDFDTREYLRRRPELRDVDVKEIKNMFDTLVPVHGYVDVKDLEIMFTNSFEMQMVNEKCGGKTRLNFDEFFDIVSGVMLDRYKKCKNVECEGTGRNVSFSCYCIPEDASRRNKKPRMEYSH